MAGGGCRVVDLHQGAIRRAEVLENPHLEIDEMLPLSFDHEGRYVHIDEVADVISVYVA